MRIPVNRKELRIYADIRRVIAKFFHLSDNRSLVLIREILELGSDQAADILRQVLREFAWRHRNITEIFERHYRRVRPFVLQYVEEPDDRLTSEQKLLIGAYFTHEYSIESAAFFNPSLILAPDQSGLPAGQQRYIISVRATGEGHISSLAFRYIIIDQNNNLSLAQPANRPEEADTIKDHLYDKNGFVRKLEEMECPSDATFGILSQLGEKFTYRELMKAINRTLSESEQSKEKIKEIEEVRWLADSHHELQFGLDTDISERIIFPVSEWESRGIEDARFVRFTYEDGRVTYYATYTAYDGFTILPKLIETTDFIKFRIRPLYGTGAQNKNLALFPRKINGKYVMLARVDGRNNYIMFSDRLTVWENPELLQSPQYSWELVQIGNCGSPVETPEGWLLVTHGVGPMRKYCLGAVLLDLDDPRRVTGRLPEPLLWANEEEREGYVPNVVYSCGSVINNGELVVPYAMSDYAFTFMTVPVGFLLDCLQGRTLEAAAANASNGVPAPVRKAGDTLHPSAGV